MTEPVVPNATSARQRVGLERLRERTDELELIISGLSLIALLSLPGWLFEQFQTYFSRFPITLAAMVTSLMPLLSAMCYLMAGLFVLHLAVRAHWVGQIGLAAVFPAGIRWERMRGVGPVSQERLRRLLPDSAGAIAAADRLASILFSLITFSALSLGILGLWITGIFLLGGWFGPHLGGTNWFINLAIGGLLQVVIGVPLLLWLLDGVIARRWPRLAGWRPFRLLISVLSRIESLYFPHRLLGPSRFTLQSNTLPRVFFPVFVIVIIVLAGLSNSVFQSGRGFDVFGSQSFVQGVHLAGGQRSQHYENQRVHLDRTRPVPMIPAPVIETAWLPVFLPYVAIIDDPVLSKRCAAASTPATPAEPAPSGAEDESVTGDAEADARSREAALCLSRLWELRLDGVPQSLDRFQPTERSDLGLRGLSGYLPLNGLTVGPHRLEVIWRPRPEQDRIDEDYVPGRIRHVIPFLWAPEGFVQPRESGPT